MHNETSKGVKSETIDGIKIGDTTVQGDKDLYLVKRKTLWDLSKGEKFLNLSYGDTRFYENLYSHISVAVIW